jgi:uncharacterized Zn-finger protein
MLHLTALSVSSAGRAGQLRLCGRAADVKRGMEVDLTMQPPEVREVDTTEVACDGGGGALGHPKVYLNMGDKREVDCPYCGRRFTLKAGAKVAAGH